MGQMVREGWHFVTRHPIMGPCMWDATATNFVCGGQMALFALYLVRDLEAPAGLVGFLLAAEGIGSLARRGPGPCSSYDGSAPPAPASRAASSRSPGRSSSRSARASRGSSRSPPATSSSRSGWSC